MNAIDRFNTIAPFYDWLADLFFGKAILKSQVHNLKLIPEGAKILIIGGGTGRWLKELLERDDTSRLWYVEASSKMIARAKINANDSERIEFIHGTEVNIPEMEFDVIITYFFLDMFSAEKLSSIIKKLTKYLSPGGLWLVADFVSQKYWHKIYLKVMYYFFRVIGAIEVGSLPSWHVSMEDNSLEGRHCHYFYGEFINCQAYVLKVTKRS